MAYICIEGTKGGDLPRGAIALSPLPSSASSSCATYFKPKNYLDSSPPTLSNRVKQTNMENHFR